MHKVLRSGADGTGTHRQTARFEEEGEVDGRDAHARSHRAETEHRTPTWIAKRRSQSQRSYQCTRTRRRRRQRETERTGEGRPYLARDPDRSSFLPHAKVPRPWRGAAPDGPRPLERRHLAVRPDGRPTCAGRSFAGARSAASSTRSAVARATSVSTVMLVRPRSISWRYRGCIRALPPSSSCVIPCSVRNRRTFAPIERFTFADRSPSTGVRTRVPHDKKHALH